MLHHLVGGSGGCRSAGRSRPGRSTVLPMALLFLPLAARPAGTSIPGPDPRRSAATRRSQHKAAVPERRRSSSVRAAIYFVVWIGSRPAAQPLVERPGRGPSDPRPAAGSRALSGPGLVLLLPDQRRSPRSTGGCRSSPTGTRRSTARCSSIGQALSTLAPDDRGRRPAGARPSRWPRPATPDRFHTWATCCWPSSCSGPTCRSRST